MPGGNNFLACVVGTNGTGKTTFLQKYCELYKRNFRNRKIYFLDPHSRIEASKNYITLNSYNLGALLDDEKKRKELWKFLESCRNSLIILDDIRCITDDRAAELLRLCIKRRQLGIDMICTYHELSSIHPSLLQYLNFIYCFRVTGDYSTIRVALKNYLPKKNFDKLLRLPNFEFEKFIIKN